MNAFAIEKEDGFASAKSSARSRPFGLYVAVPSLLFTTLPIGFFALVCADAALDARNKNVTM